MTDVTADFGRGARRRPALFEGRRRHRDATRPRRDVRLRLVPMPADDAGERQTGLGVAMVVLVVLLSLIGSVMILSASSVVAVELGGSSFSVFFKQCAWLAVGLGALYIGARTDYRRWADRVPLLVIGSVGLLMLVLVPGVGINVNGAQRWIGAAGFQLQPAEPA